MLKPGAGGVPGTHRAPHLISLFQQLRREAMGGIGTGAGAALRKVASGPADPADVFQEISAKGDYAKKLQEDIEMYRTVLESFRGKVASFQPASIEDMQGLIAEVDAVLSKLTDETAVLKAVGEWPDGKWDSMKECVALHRELSGYMRELEGWEVNAKATAEAELSRMDAYLERLMARHGVLLRSRDTDNRKFASFALPWDPAILAKLQATSLRLTRLYLELGLGTARPLLAAQPPKRADVSRACELLRSCIRHSFRAHQFVQGIDDDVDRLVRELGDVFKEATALESSLPKEPEQTPLKLVRKARATEEKAPEPAAAAAPASVEKAAAPGPDTGGAEAKAQQAEPVAEATGAATAATAAAVSSSSGKKAEAGSSSNSTATGSSPAVAAKEASSPTAAAGDALPAASFFETAKY